MSMISSGRAARLMLLVGKYKIYYVVHLPSLPGPKFPVKFPVTAFIRANSRNLSLAVFIEV